MAPTFSKYAAPPEDTRYYAAAPPIQLQRPRRVEWDSGTYLNLRLLAVPHLGTQFSYPVRAWLFLLPNW